MPGTIIGIDKFRWRKEDKRNQHGELVFNLSLDSGRNLGLRPNTSSFHG